MPSLVPTQMSTTNATIGAGAIFVLLLLRTYWTSRHHVPPGPRPLPLIGNVLDMPQSEFALTWTKFGEQYGPMTWLAIPGQPFLILNSLEAAKELLGGRGSIYTDRPRFTMATNLMGFESLTPLSRPNPEWRSQRTLLKHALSVEVIKRDYSALISKKVQEYLGGLLNRPESFLGDLHRIIAETIVELTYGKRAESHGRDFVKLNARVTEILDRGMQGYAVDLIPALQYLPRWLPGMGFKRDAAKWKKESDDLRESMFQSVKESMAAGDPRIESSFMVNNLKALYQNQGDSKSVQQTREDEQTINHTGFSFYISGVETVTNAIRAFMLAMVLFPSVQEKAQAEIDRVIGPERLPALDDEQSLPYLHAVMIEVLRWSPASAGGVPHASIMDDVYNGYFIPKGTAVIANTWGITRNPKHYTNPSTFDPERYLKPDPELDPREYAFGYGRRACPGYELTFRIAWLMAASILWSFRLKRSELDTRPLDTDSDRFSITVLCTPVDFKSEFTPRQENIKEKMGVYVH